MKISDQISFCLEVLPDKFKNYFRLWTYYIYISSQNDPNITHAKNYIWGTLVALEQIAPEIVKFNLVLVSLMQFMTTFDSIE